jgi:nucleoside-diphosphate-sugar epimerase
MELQRILVTGGAGYIGCRLVPELIRRGCHVRVLDCLLFGADALNRAVGEHPQLEIVAGDIRDVAAVDAALHGMQAVIHLAALSNDPSADISPHLTTEVNLHAVNRLVDRAAAARIRRFVNASSATVYGVRPEPEVTEECDRSPITLYGRLKDQTEQYVLAANGADMTTTSIRAATVCGYSPRLRLDLLVNIFTEQALTRRNIVVHGGGQVRPSIHIDDLVDAYCFLLNQPAEQVGGLAFNVGDENLTVWNAAALVAKVMADRGRPIDIERLPIADQRSYRLNSNRIAALGFAAKRSTRQAIEDLADAFEAGLVPEPQADIYRNVQHLLAVGVE